MQLLKGGERGPDSIVSPVANLRPVGPNPKYDLAAWDLTVFGEVENEVRLSWDALMALPNSRPPVSVDRITS